MSEPLFKVKGASKAERYEAFLRLYAPFIEGETDAVTAMANTAAALREAFGFFWVGFYTVKEDHLQLAPFQGPVACSRIRYGHGVCGTAWQQQQTIVVPDVEQFPGHIACSSLSRSEIVVPVVANGRVLAVLDVDSTDLNAFDNTDRKYLEQVATLLAQHSTL
jgi:GAF domain-containing protein